MNKSIRYFTLCVAILALMFGSLSVQAKPPIPRPGDVSLDDSWQAAPNDFVFGNHIDTHIQLRLEEENGQPVSLRGSFYIIFTDDQGISLGTDPASGLPIARHPRGTSENHNETCGVSPNIECLVGWHMDGIPGAAKYLYHSGVNGDDHPVWMVNRAEESSAPAPGMVIPQPGFYSHYHWITTASTDPRAASVPAACDKKNAGKLQDEAPTAVEEVCQGWFLQVQAVRDFAFKHGGEISPIYSGEDLRSHLNIVTNYDETPVVTITETRTSGGH